MTAATPCRSNHQTLADFAQHVGVAQELLVHFQDIPRRLGNEDTADTVEVLRAEARVAWEGLWDHLWQARAIASSMGRSVATYDEARRIAGNIWPQAFDFDVGPWQRTLDGRRQRTITWRNAATAPATDAIEALKSAVPEATLLTISSPAPPEVDLRRHGWLIDRWPVIAAIVLIPLVAWLCNACRGS